MVTESVEPIYGPSPINAELYQEWSLLERMNELRNRMILNLNCPAELLEGGSSFNGSEAAMALFKERLGFRDTIVESASLEDIDREFDT